MSKDFNGLSKESSFDIKGELDNKISDLHEKEYGWFDYISGIAWTIWVNTYHRYYNTNIYREYLIALRFLEEYRRSVPQHIVDKFQLR